MEGYQNIKRQLLPLVKGSPVVIGIFVLFLFMAKQIINYTPNMYQTIAKIKLDNQKYGFSATGLYEDFDVFSTENKIESEAEILKSPLLVGMALDSLDFNVVVYRKGKVKNTMLYNDNPLVIEYKFENEKLFDKIFELKIKNENQFEISGTIDNVPFLEQGQFNRYLQLDGGKILVKKNTALLAVRTVPVIGEYECKVFSENGLIQDVISKLDVTAIDKEIAVLRVVYKDENPQKVADFTNMLCNAYIEDYTITKTSAAKLTAEFAAKKMNEVGIKLRTAERNLERYKLQNNIVNTRQETETGLREISKLKIQLINLEMNEKVMQKLQNYIENGDYFDETAINFGFGDLLMTELVKKLKFWQDERHDLITIYTLDNEKVTTVDSKIAEVKNYIKEAIKQNLNEIRTKKTKIEETVEIAKHMFDKLPTREKNQHILEREFRLLESVYNFLSHKKIEASIAASAYLSFHRVLQPAVVPKTPISPNKTLITFVNGLLGLIVGIGFIYLRRYAQAMVISREDLERNATLPVAGVIRTKNTDRDFQMLIKGLLLKETITTGNLISVSSTLSGEGKTYIAHHVAQTMINLGYKVCLIDANEENPQQLITSSTLQEFEKSEHKKNNVLVALTIGSLKGLTAKKRAYLTANFDFVIIDTAATAINISALEMMKISHLNLYVVRANYTQINYMSQPDLLKEEYKLKNLQLVLNDAHKATNYSGNYVGSRFQYNKKQTGILAKINHYYQTYIT